MSKIFISYRRDDTGFGADRVHEAALDYVKKRNDVFMDIDGIPPGDDFVDRIAEKVSQCDVLFALIGRDWLTIKDPKTGLRRLDGPDDFVRIEIASALKREIPVVPLLMGEAEMPSAEQLPDDLKPLVRRNARSVGRASFKHDMSELMAGLGIKRQPKQRSKLILTLIAAGLVVTFVLGAQFIFGPFSGGDVGNAGDDVAYEDETIGLRLSYYEFGPEPCDYVDITVYLRTNRSMPTEFGTAVLARALRDAEGPCIVQDIEVRGYSYETGSREYDLGVSGRFASNVATILTDLGVYPELISSRGLGREGSTPGNPKTSDNRVEVRLELSNP